VIGWGRIVTNSTKKSSKSDFLISATPNSRHARSGVPTIGQQNLILDATKLTNPIWRAYYWAAEPDIGRNKTDQPDLACLLFAVHTIGKPDFHPIFAHTPKF
jgi:hypothetical protein